MYIYIYIYTIPWLRAGVKEMPSSAPFGPAAFAPGRRVSRRVFEGQPKQNKQHIAHLHKQHTTE